MSSCIAIARRMSASPRQRIHAERRIGVFGGTFDPVHNGHLHIARGLRDSLHLDQVIWVPAGRPPHKTGQIVSSDSDRLAMLKLALAESESDKISTIELDRFGPSYTADTLESLNAQLEPVNLVFLMGEDSLRDLPTWHAPSRILRAARLAVAGRPGIETDLDSIVEALPAISGRIDVVPIGELAISSSDIRQRVAADETISGLLPPAVERYIADHHLYRSRHP